MAITDIQISEELETNAPSIKYRGDEGPKSPQEIEEQMMAGMMEDIARDFEREFGYDMGLANPEVVTEYIKVWKSRQGDTSRGPVLPNDPTKPVNPWTPKPQGPTLPNRQMAAYGGIMGLDGRKQYGIGSWWQEKIMDPIKKNPLLTAAAAAYGLDTFGGEDGILGGKLPGGGKIVNKGISNIWEKLNEKKQGNKIYKEVGGKPVWTGKYEENPSILGNIGSALTDNLVPIVGGLTAGLFTKNTESDTPGLPSDNTALQLADLKKSANILDQKQAMAAGLNFTPAVSARKYTPEEMIETYATAANGGRIGFNMGGGADMGSPQMGGIQTFMRSNSGTDYVTTVMESLYQQNEDKYQSPDDPQLAQDALMVVQKSVAGTFANGGRIGRAEGGLMDLGGMEKDYRAEGGFVPIGKAEKADDVPARLSVNEFVFTADAVRNAGGGDIDKGAEVMENMMKNLEAGGQVSEESQGMQGAQQMFETSERLSEVI